MLGPNRNSVAATRGAAAVVVPVRLLAWSLAAALAVLVVLMGGGSARAAFGVAAFDAEALDSSGAAYTQAGGHPFALTTSIDFNTHTRTVDPFGLDVLSPDEPVKDVRVDVPPGFAGYPPGIRQCRMDQLTFPSSAQGSFCPSASQVGVANVTTDGVGTLFNTTSGLPVYNMVPPPGVPARFGFIVAGPNVVVVLDATVRNGSDYGLSVNVRNINESIAVLGTQLTLWGVPADPAHDPQRACPGQQWPGGGGPPASDPACPTQVSGASLPQVPFLRMPTSCPADASTGLQWAMSTDSWTNPGVQQTATVLSHIPPGLIDAPDFPGLPSSSWGPQRGMTGCADVPFSPAFTAKPATPASPGASGYVFDLSSPQTSVPSILDESDLRTAVVTLPVGVRVNPSEADGLQGCSPAQVDLHSSDDASCPDASKIGSMEIRTPALAQPLEGSVYLATPHDNASGNSLLAVYLVAKGPGVIVKLPGSVSPDARTGQLKATFDNLPQLPFSLVHVEFFGGDRAPLTNPPTCGTYTTTAVLTGWSGKQVTSDSSFTTSHDGHGAPCPPAQFKPTLTAGTTSPIAAAHSPLTVTVTRSDDDQELASIDSIGMPNGLTARIKSVPLCKNAQSRAGTCGSASQIGTVTAAAGTGPDPFAVKGRVYLAGKYKTAPYSLSVVVPVIAGPFDLGTVVLRSAVFVDRHTATLRVVTDPLPTILQGIPLQVRIVNVTIDRSRFILNPTSCAPKQITSTIRSTGGLVAHPSTRFQAAECRSLNLTPKMVLRVGGRGHTGLHASTPLTATLTDPAGQSNLRAVAVSLPSTINARLNVVNNACTQAQFDAGHCEAAKAGTAVAVTPLLPHALRGGVYFVKDPKKPKGALPNLVVALRGAVSFDLVGRIVLPGGVRLATHFDHVPDVPITKFVLRLVAGSRGPVGTAANLCSASAKRQTAGITFAGQNGKVLSVRQALQVAGCRTRARR